MKRCQNYIIIPFLNSKMAFDCGMGRMFREQAILMYQVIGKITAVDAERMVRYASQKSYAQLDYFKKDFMIGAIKQGYSVNRIADEWYRLAFQASYLGYAPSNNYIKEKYTTMSKLYDIISANPNIKENEIENLIVASDPKWREDWADMIRTITMIAKNAVSDDDSNS